MLGIVLISHGEMAKGMAQTATLFLGDSIEQFEHCCLYAEDDPEKFHEVIQKAITKVDTGEGVLILADLFGGTPCNQAIPLLNDSIDLIAGVNLPTLLEILMSRANGKNIDDLIVTGQKGICNVKSLLNSSMIDDEDE